MTAQVPETWYTLIQYGSSKTDTLKRKKCEHMQMWMVIRVIVLKEKSGKYSSPLSIKILNFQFWILNFKLLFNRVGFIFIVKRNVDFQH